MGACVCVCVCDREGAKGREKTVVTHADTGQIRLRHLPMGRGSASLCTALEETMIKKTTLSTTFTNRPTRMLLPRKPKTCRTSASISSSHHRAT